MGKSCNLFIAETSKISFAVISVFSVVRLVQQGFSLHKQKDWKQGNSYPLPTVKKYTFQQLIILLFTHLVLFRNTLITNTSANLRVLIRVMKLQKADNFHLQYERCSVHLTSCLSRHRNKNSSA